MSSQGLNATIRNSTTSYRFNPPTNTNPGVPGAGLPRAIYASQFASDITKLKKEVTLYNEHVGHATATGFTEPVNFSIVQSNQNRKTYQFGKAACDNGCTGGFPTNPLGT